MFGPKSNVSFSSSSVSLDVVDVMLPSSSDDVDVLLLVVLPSVVLPSVVLPRSLEVVLLSLELPEEDVESLSSSESELVMVPLPTELESSVPMVSTSVMSHSASWASRLEAELAALLRKDRCELGALMPDGRLEPRVSDEEREEPLEEPREEPCEEPREEPCEEAREEDREAVELRKVDWCEPGRLPSSSSFGLPLFLREEPRGGRCGSAAFRSMMKSSTMGFSPPANPVGASLPPSRLLSSTLLSSSPLTSSLLPPTLLPSPLLPPQLLSSPVW